MWLNFYLSRFLLNLKGMYNSYFYILMMLYFEDYENNLSNFDLIFYKMNLFQKMKFDIYYYY